MSAAAKYLLNRNPRCLERLGYMRKTLGYQFEEDSQLRSYYYKIVYSSTKRNVTAYVTHFKDGTVLEASTLEPEVRNRLPRTADFTANETIGRLLAYRCLKAGINYVHRGVTDVDFEKMTESKKAFYKGLEDGGLILDEPPMIEANWQLDKRYHWVVPEMEDGKEYDKIFTPQVEKTPSLKESSSSSEKQAVKRDKNEKAKNTAAVNSSTSI